MQSFTQWARCDQQTSQFSDIRFTIHRLKFTLAANGKEFYGQVILFYLSRMLEKTKPMVNYLMNNLGFVLHSGWKPIEKSYFTMF